MQSIWEKDFQMPEREALPGDLRCGAAVIGGGMAGILTAHFLQKRGVDAVVLEADRVGGGQTSGTTAHITAQHGAVYAKLCDNLGSRLAAQYAMANERAVADFRELARGVDCDFEELPAALFSRQDGDILEKEAEAAARAGLKMRLERQADLPFAVKNALYLDHQAMFQPLKFLRALAEPLRVYEHTRVLSVEGGRVHTERGDVRCEQVAFCCHYPFVNVPGYYFMRMHQQRGYVLALKGPARLNAMYMGVDAGQLSLRSYQDCLLLGGEGHRTGENGRGGRYERLEETARALYPASETIARWSAQDCITLDGAPYIGRFSAAAPAWYVATGFGTWGMTHSMVAARVLSQLMAGEGVPDVEVFAPDRFLPSAQARSLMGEGAHAASGLLKTAFEPPRAALDALPRGHGGIVEAGGRKAGVYKDESGEVYVVSVRCPHLGCQLEWNPDEKSWDCPCHGSRFDYRGNLINNPAQEGLQHVEPFAK